MALRRSKHLYRRALNALRRRLSDVFFAEDRDAQVPDLVINLTEGNFRKFAGWCKSFFELGHISQSAIDLILRQRSKDPLDVLNLRNAMANHRHVVPCRSRRSRACCAVSPPYSCWCSPWASRRSRPPTPSPPTSSSSGGTRATTP